MFAPRKNIRLKGYNYSQPGFYFVTICTKNRMECFGKVEGNSVKLDKVGIVAEKFWKELPLRYDCVDLDAFVVMPNHLHGVIIIKKHDATPGRGAAGLHPLIPNSLGSVINHYKGAVKKELNRTSFDSFQWQSRFYDHVIRDEGSLNRIREYIKNNPINWEKDRNNSEGLWI